MKTTMSKQFLFLAAFGCIVAPVAAQTVDVTLQCGQTYTINSTAPATTGAGLTYRWLENGSVVAGTAATYTVPATKHAGSYTYIRQAQTAACPDWQSSNALTVAVVSHSDGICISGLTWAKYNVDVPGSFTKSIGDPGKLYQFNRTKPWVPNPDLIYDLPSNTDMEWSVDSTVCPTGWRLPTIAEIQSLVKATPLNADGSQGYWSYGDPIAEGKNVVWIGPISMPPVDQYRHMPFPLAPIIWIDGTSNNDEPNIWSCCTNDAGSERVIMRARTSTRIIMAGWVPKTCTAYVRCVR
ncbi:MAG: hypothetical protein LBD52_01755 [Prevotellaceae bacterium]|jgi:uncharacterized protein (TIGR02145 family)|nr:hypothetical protein [Prevotellaceae bacterium]